MGFEIVVVVYLFLYQGIDFPYSLYWLTSSIFEDVTPVLVKCVVSSGSAWITLSTCTSFALLLCFTNFANLRSLSDWMGFEVVDIKVSWRSSFILEIFSSFGFSHGLLPLDSQEFRLSSVRWHCFFLLLPPLKSQLHF